MAEALAQEWLSPGFGYMVRVSQRLVDRQTPYQHLEVLDTPQFGHVLRLDGALQCSERDEFFYHEPLVHVPALLHPDPHSALVLGGGDGGAAEELLKHPGMQSVQLVEIDADVIDVSRQWLAQVNQGVFDGADTRFRWTVEDGRDWLARHDWPFDLILLDLTDPGGASAPLYTDDFFALCARRLAPGGMLALHVASPWAQAERAAGTLAALRRSFGCVMPYLASVPVSGGAWLMAVAMRRFPGWPDGAALQARMSRMTGEPLRYVTPELLRQVFALPRYLEALTA